jgi:hypothetical protein
MGNLLGEEGGGLGSASMTPIRSSETRVKSDHPATFNFSGGKEKLQAWCPPSQQVLMTLAGKILRFGKIDGARVNRRVSLFPSLGTVPLHN